MNRLGLLHPSQLDAEAKRLYDAYHEYTTNRYGKAAVAYMLDDARLTGPFGVQLHTPQVGEHVLGLAKALRSLPGLSDTNREIASIVVGVRYNTRYELAMHQMLGWKFGLAAASIDTMLAGKKPASFNAEQSVVFDVAHELAYGSGTLPQDLWDRAVEVLGRPGTIALVQYVGFYSYACTILRGFDVEIPVTDRLGRGHLSK
ncbi:AhpD-like protein [Neohortaea acidophila]|uniref:AhpD-like protein n=1 Tax=Neohortaea acidophila TaxID=245834 RepID=A0A6A6PSR6_9PEZI|nr:AhpD-like protein [Neohortaea acidophila]KAF2482533.1 AhpD-like protein [Neohortaea acidophila]